MRHFLILSYCLCLGLAVSAQSSSLFDSEDVLEFTIKSDFIHFLANRGLDAGYQPAVISYQSANGQPIEISLKIKVRGRYRRDPLVCGFPPVRLNFDKDDDLPTPFTGQDKIKLVTHCADEQYIFREYYLYKVFQLLSDTSFRVRIARITYEDVNGARPSETRFAFLIESEEELAKRFGGEPLDEDIRLNDEDVARRQLSNVHLFNYMIANKDFDIQVRQNVKVIDIPDTKPYVIPYDFDWSGVVNASYTKLSTSPGPVYKKRQRYQPLCRTNAEYEALIEEFEAIRPAIFDLYQSSPYLNQDQVKETLGYFKQFYRTVKKGKTMDEVLLKGCK